jgi:hypothetical protein
MKLWVSILFVVAIVGVVLFALDKFSPSTMTLLTTSVFSGVGAVRDWFLPGLWQAAIVGTVVVVVFIVGIKTAWKYMPMMNRKAQEIQAQRLISTRPDTPGLTAEQLKALEGKG